MVPEVPDPPLERGAPYWYWLGGRPALDLVNTRRERWRRNVECLTGDRDAVDWLVAAQLLPEAPRRAPRGLAVEARALREAIDEGVRAAVAGEPVDAQALALIDHWLDHAGSRPALVLGADGRPQFTEHAPVDYPGRALGMVALDAARMLGAAEERARIRICGSETCSARFYDRSPAAVRRWCSMQACGNVAKARRHRARKRPERTAAA
jgi:predicted RNA-binding Zn ribbon-like protein